MHLDAEGHMTGANGEYVPRIESPPFPKLNKDEAMEIAIAEGESNLVIDEGDVSLVYLFAPDLDEPKLSWKVERSTKGGMKWDAVWISADDGEVLREELLVRFSTEVRSIWDYQKTTSPAFWVHRYQNTPPIDIGCTEIVLLLDSINLMSSLWSSEFGRDSFDDLGGTMTAYYKSILTQNIPQKIVAWLERLQEVLLVFGQVS